MGEPIGLDMGAVMQIGAAVGADTELLAEILPSIEVAILAGLDDEDDDEPETEDDDG